MFAGTRTRGLALLVTLLAYRSLSAGTQVPSQSATARPSSAAADGLIGGVIVDAATDAPVPAVVVTLTPAGKNPFQSGVRVLTDNSGRFFFASLIAGEYTLTSTKPGWLDGAFGRHRAGGASVPLQVGTGEHKGDIRIDMWKVAVIAGHVADETGDPLVGIGVRIFQQHYAAGRPQYSFKGRAITDDRGAYRFSNLVPGDYIVIVPAAVTSEPPAFRLQSETPRTYLQTMTALGAAPVSMDAATIAAGTNRPLLSSALAMPQLPTANGAWTTYATTMFPSTIKLDEAEIIRAVSGRERAGTDITVHMAPTYQVSGMLTSTESTPPALHAVHLLPADSADHPVFDVATAVTDGNGAFTFYGVPPGQYVARVVRLPSPGGSGRLGQCGGTGAIKFVCSISEGPGPVTVSRDPLLFAEQRVLVTDSNVGDLMLALRSGHRVSGRIAFDGSTPHPTAEELTSIRVRLERADGQTAEPAGGFDPTQDGSISSDGTFMTPSTMPGRYLVRVTNAPKGWTFKNAVYEAREVSETALVLNADISGVTLTLTDTAAKIAGSVIGLNGQPDDHALVLMFPAESSRWVDYGRTSRRILSAPSASGKFSLSTPPTGEYCLIAIPANFDGDWQDPTFLAKVAPQADRVIVTDGQSLTHPVQVRRIQ